MILTILASLSSYCQYPITKVINSDTVVIMTLNQGREINNQFVVLKDSLNNKSKDISLLKTKINQLDFQLKDTVKTYNEKFLKLNQENIFLVEEKKRIEKRIWSDRRERRFTSIGILFATMGWFTLYLISK